MPVSNVQIGVVPFTEAIKFFRDKLNIPTKHFDDLMGDIHAKAFTVAGAMKLDLLGDIRQAVDQAISNGSTITEFRKHFDKAVQKHGWSYKGKRGWRTRVIFDNNLRTAHMAGRWQQFQRVKETRPFLQYQTVGDSRVRPQHAAWDGITLAIDDSWWDTHMPPNGWGCRCTVISLSPRKMRRDKVDINQAPALKSTERINVHSGEIYGKVPEGIDPGWNYNVGKAWLAPESSFGTKLASQPPAIRSKALSNAATLTMAKKILPGYKAWANDVFVRDKNMGDLHVVGYINDNTIVHAENNGVKVSDATITMSDSRLRRMLKPKNRRSGKALVPEAELLKLPIHLASPEAILWDKKEKSVVYVFDIKHKNNSRGKFFVRLNFKQAGEYTNSVRSAGVVDNVNLTDTNNYELLEGKL